MSELLKQKLQHSFPIPTSRYFVIDSFPLPVCKFGRARYCRSFCADGANYGKCPSKKETYFGFKVHALITLESYIMAFEIPPCTCQQILDTKYQKIVSYIVKLYKLYATLDIAPRNAGQVMLTV